MLTRVRRTLPALFHMSAAVAAALASETDARAQWTVPGDFPTIQAAIAAAADSTTIEVAPGTYNESLTFLGKTITVRSTGGPEVTTIDGAGLGASVVWIPIGSDAGTRLEGFTIRGGSSLTGLASGGGVRVTSSVVTVANCIITQNVATVGAGIAVRFGGNATFEDCVIAANSTVGPPGSFHSGGAAYVQSSTAAFQRCRVVDNHSGIGTAGIALVFSQGTLVDCLLTMNGNFLSTGVLEVNGTASADVTRCVFRENQGGSVVWMPASGASTFDSCRFEDNHCTGILAAGTDPAGLKLDIVGCEFIGNWAEFSSGAGVLLYPGDDDVTLAISDTRFVGNRADYGATVNVNVFPGFETTCTIQGCRFEWNSGQEAGAVHVGLEPGSEATLSMAVSGCTFSNNHALAGGGLSVDDLAVVELDGTSFCGNVGGDIVGSVVDGGGNTFSLDCKDWTNLGSGLPGVFGPPPTLIGDGELVADQGNRLLLDFAHASSPAVLLVGTASHPTPFKGGVLVPVPVLLAVPVLTDAGGTVELEFRWPAGLPFGFDFFYQYAILDPLAAQDVALSNAVRAMAP